jgi:hypothetical protein
MKNMADPQSSEEYNARFQASRRMSGYGLDTTVHLPCPFCAAPDWLVHRVIDTEAAMSEGATCQECGRSARAIINTQNGNKTFEIVQTGGFDPPPWHRKAFPMRRAEKL